MEWPVKVNLKIKVHVSPTHTGSGAVEGWAQNQVLASEKENEE